MTVELVIESTGEVVEVMSQIEAERITAQIADKLDAIADNLELVMPLIREAITRQAHVALGYPSVGAYVSERFKGSLTRLPRELRTEVVKELSDAGMSTRAIAPVVGADYSTVSRDRKVGVASATPGPKLEPEWKSASDLLAEGCRTLTYQHGIGLVGPGEEVPIDTETTVDLDTGEEIQERKITGIDGKRYNRPEPRPTAEPAKPRQRPITDAFWELRYDLGKKAESLHRLTQDDRWARNAEKVAEANLHDLLQTRDLLQQVINQLPTDEG